jgi:hypothetical protein
MKACERLPCLFPLYCLWVSFSIHSTISPSSVFLRAMRALAQVGAVDLGFLVGVERGNAFESSAVVKLVFELLANGSVLIHPVSSVIPADVDLVSNG